MIKCLFSKRVPLGLIFCLWLAGAREGFAQLETTPFEVVYTQVMQPPRLPDGSSSPQAIQAAVQQRLLYRRKAGSPTLKNTDGAIVTLVVHASGRVGKMRMLSNLGPDFQQALRKAIAQLPLFEPGRQEGEKVGVFYAFAIGANNKYKFNPDVLASAMPPPDWPIAERAAWESPRLPGGQSLFAAMDERLILPPAGSPTPLASAPTVSLTFTVNQKGYIVDPVVEPTSTLAFNRAALQTLAEMPLFKPGTYKGKPVAVSMSCTVLYPRPEHMEQAREEAMHREPPASERVISEQLAPKTATVCTDVEQMPQLNGSGGYAELGAAIKQRVPATAAVSCTGSRVLVAFIVRADGTLTDARILKGSGNSCEAAVLAAVRKLPPLQPGKQNGRVVTVSCVIAVAF